MICSQWGCNSQETTETRTRAVVMSYKSLRGFVFLASAFHPSFAQCQLNPSTVALAVVMTATSTFVLLLSSSSSLVLPLALCSLSSLKGLHGSMCLKAFLSAYHIVVLIQVLSNTTFSFAKYFGSGVIVGKPASFSKGKRFTFSLFFHRLPLLSFICCPPV